MTALAPEPGRIALVRQRRYLVENVTPPPSQGDAMLVDLSCLDDDAQGEPLSILWEHEIGARVLEDAGWSAVAEKGFDDPALFAAYLRTLSWNCVTATDPNLFQAPFRAGIRLDAYQLDPLRKALRLGGPERGGSERGAIASTVSASTMTAGANDPTALRSLKGPVSKRMLCRTCASSAYSYAQCLC